MNMMHKHTGYVSMDPEFQTLRINTQDRICKWLEGRLTNQSSQLKQRLPHIAKWLEDCIFKESLNKDDYITKFNGAIGIPIINMLKQMKQNQVRQQQWRQQQWQQQNHQQTMVHHNMQSVPMNQMHSNSQGFGDGMMNNDNGLELLVNNLQQLMIDDSTSNPTQQTSDRKHDT